MASPPKEYLHWAYNLRRVSMRVDNLPFRVSKLSKFKQKLSAGTVLASRRICCAVPVLRFRRWGFGCLFSDFRVSSFGFRISGCGFRVSGFELRSRVSGFRVSGFGSRSRVSGVRARGFGFWATSFGCGGRCGEDQ